MKIAVSSYGKDLNSQIDPRFGRCAYFLIVNTDDMSFEAFENKGVSLTGGAGAGRGSGGRGRGMGRGRGGGGCGRGSGARGDRGLER
jgi:hypothetical protein